MSDCPDCENTGFTWELSETPGDELKGEWHRSPCRNWRHRVRPTLAQIASALREARDPPPTHMIPETEIPF